MKTFPQFIERMERSILGRIGAGQSPTVAFKLDRWTQEMAEDLQVAPEAAHRANVKILESLVAAYALSPTVQSAKAVFAEFRAPTVPIGDSDLELSGGEGDHMVYKLFDGSRGLLYIGITSRGPARLVEHHRRKPWFKYVETVEFERFETRSASARREAYLIERYAPLYNVQHNRGRARGYPPEYALP